MKRAVALFALMLCAPPLAAQDEAAPASAPRCGEPCSLSRALKALRDLPPMPAKDPIPGAEFEPPVKAYSDCVVTAFRAAGDSADWGAPAEQTDAALSEAASQCGSLRIDATLLFLRHFETEHPALTDAQKRVYASYVIGMHGMMTLTRDADARGKQDAARRYLASRVDKDDMAFALRYFDGGN